MLWTSTQRWQCTRGMRTSFHLTKRVSLDPFRGVPGVPACPHTRTAPSADERNPAVPALLAPGLRSCRAKCTHRTRPEHRGRVPRAAAAAHDHCLRIQTLQRRRRRRRRVALDSLATRGLARGLGRVTRSVIVREAGKRVQVAVQAQTHRQLRNRMGENRCDHVSPGCTRTVGFRRSTRPDAHAT